MKLYVDMDGVLTDFDMQLSELMHKPLKRPMFDNEPEYWAAITKAGEKFWSNMPWMSDGKVLWDAVKQYKPTILTSPTRDKSSVEGKKIWLAENLPEVPFIIDKNKDKYASEGDILIDDREKNVRKWREAGGTGILHKDAPSTLKELVKVLKKEDGISKQAKDLKIFKPRQLPMAPGDPTPFAGVPTPKIKPPEKGQKTPYKRQQEKDVSRFVYAAAKIRLAAADLLQTGKPELILTVGVPGSGKSYWIKSQSGYVVISPDDIRREIGGDVSDQSKNAQVWALAKQRTMNALNKGQNVILDATNVDAPYRKSFISGLPDCTLKAKIFDVSPEVAKARVRKDFEQKKDRAQVPDEVIDRMHERFKSTVDENQLEAEGFQVI